ncbi:hypothetical protein Neosp_014449 [[Neocosmospora] mangrovei]
MDKVPALTIYNMPPSLPNWDSVGVFYVTFCAVWTTLVFSGMAFCLANRNNPILRLRGLPLSFSAIAFLHCYWVLGQIVYPIGATVPTVLAYDIQYFFMGIWFPLGIALFQASNARFLHIAKLQKQFTSPHLRAGMGCNGSHSSWLCRLRNMNYTKRIMIFIGFGMIFQVLLTVGMWLACRKYHPTFGIPGTEIRGATVLEQLIDLGRGWEWWPSVLWQVIWTWIVAPILIWRAWGIRDTMGWRTQTIGCCISKIHLSVFMFEIFTIFVPACQVIQQWAQAKRAAAHNARWETDSQITTLRTSHSTERKHSASQSITEKSQTIDYADSAAGDRLYTMSALNQVLDDNPGPLQDFSALSDFSGENIAFLTRLARWKASWYAEPSKEQTLEAYNRALELYADFISPRDAEFPLNLSSPDLKYLEEIFEKATRILCGEARVDPALPFEMPSSAGTGSSRSLTLTSRARYTGDIPGTFGPTVFDAAEGHVKYLVLTNTWPKFVKEMQSRRRSTETARSGFSDESDMTLTSRVSDKIATFVRSLV